MKRKILRSNSTRSLDKLFVTKDQEAIKKLLGISHETYNKLFNYVYGTGYNYEAIKLQEIKNIETELFFLIENQPHNPKIDLLQKKYASIKL